jgi:hypothetical protein
MLNVVKHEGRYFAVYTFIVLSSWWSNEEAGEGVNKELSPDAEEVIVPFLPALRVLCPPL